MLPVRKKVIPDLEAPSLLVVRTADTHWRERGPPRENIETLSAVPTSTNWLSPRNVVRLFQT